MKRCPHCHSHPSRTRSSNVGGWIAWVTCECCHATGPTTPPQSTPDRAERLARKLWDHRSGRLDGVSLPPTLGGLDQGPLTPMGRR